jgi:copper chaperone CopZ
MLIQMEVGDLEGVMAVEADHRTQVVDVDFDADVVAPQDIVSAIVKLGYGVEDGEA